MTHEFSQMTPKKLPLLLSLLFFDEADVPGLQPKSHHKTAPAINATTDRTPTPVMATIGVSGALVSAGAGTESSVICLAFDGSGSKGDLSFFFVKTVGITIPYPSWTSCHTKTMKIIVTLLSLLVVGIDAFAPASRRDALNFEFLLLELSPVSSPPSIGVERRSLLWLSSRAVLEKWGRAYSHISFRANVDHVDQLYR